MAITDLEAKMQAEAKIAELQDQNGALMQKERQMSEEIQRLKARLALAEEDKAFHTAAPFILKRCTRQQLRSLHERLESDLNDTVRSLERVIVQEAKLEASEEAGRCRICEERAMDCVLLPCGHFGCCSICAHGSEERGCPFCRCPVEQIKKTFLC